jgi:hypothetical protein
MPPPNTFRNKKPQLALDFLLGNDRVVGEDPTEKRERAFIAQWQREAVASVELERDGAAALAEPRPVHDQASPHPA